MVVYEVTVEIDAERAPAFERYMRGRHVGEVLATGCFVRARFERDGDGRYRTRYEAENHVDVERYLDEYTAALRTDFHAHFPDGVRVTRAEWFELARWDESP